jgi:two-component system, OmpR family, sensor histidine kinase MprB
VVFCALLLASMVLYPAMDTKLREQQDSELVAAAARTEGLAASSGTGPRPSRGAESPGEPVNTGILWLLTSSEGGKSDGAFPLSRRDAAVAAHRAPAYFQNAEYHGVSYRVYTAPRPGSDGKLARTAVPLSLIDATLDRLRVLLVLITVGGTALATLAACLAAGRVLRPVRRLTEAVEHVTATQDLSARIETRGKDEIARLARSFSSMMVAVEESVRMQRRLVADASHELRTPLTSLKTNLELLDEQGGLTDPEAPKLVDDACGQAEELTSLVNDLVDLARYSSIETHSEDTRLDLLVEGVVARAATRASQPDFHTELEPCLVHADPDALARAVSNLVDNAAKWSPQGGRVFVRVDADGTVSVADQGPGIPVADLPRIFDRFYRSPASRSMPGSGLGLAIVRQVVETHGGTILAEPLEQGVRLRMSLPTVV